MRQKWPKNMQRLKKKKIKIGAKISKNKKIWKKGKFFFLKSQNWGKNG